MKQLFYSACFIFLLAAINSCKKPGCFGEAGKITTVTRPLAAFSQLILNDNIDLVLTQGNNESMTIESPENIQPNISGDISGGILTISNKTDCRWLRKPGEKITVHLQFRDLQKIDYRGSGNISNTDTIKVDALQIETALGAGDIELTVNNRYTGAYIFQESAGITLHGKSETCFTYTNSRGTADLGDLEVKKMVIEYGGLADTKVNVTDELDAIIYYKGNILYKGNPVITRSQYYSSGRVIKTP